MLRGGKVYCSDGCAAGQGCVHGGCNCSPREGTPIAQRLTLVPRVLTAALRVRARLRAPARAETRAGAPTATWNGDHKEEEKCAQRSR